MYAPKINTYYMARLYKLKQIKKKPITQMVQEAIIEYLSKHDKYYEVKK